MRVAFCSWRCVSRLVALTGMLPMAACIAHAPGNQQQKQISVTVTGSVASPASIPVSTATTPSTIQYTATVTGTGNTAVTWSLAAASNSSTVCTATGAALGTITATGADSITYTAPTEVPVSPCGVAVTATSNEDNSSKGQSLVNVHIMLAISPLNDTIGQGANFQYTSTLVGAPTGNDGVVWSANCPTCPSQQTGGAFDVNNPGLFIAPGLMQDITNITTTITATPNFDPTQAQTATMTVLKTDPLGTVTPSTAVAAQTTCPVFSAGAPGSTCYKVKVSCDGIADWSAYLKVNQPSGNPLGTVVFSTGSGGGTLYDNDSNFINGTFNGGDNIVERVLNTTVADAGYTTVQVSFGAPFDNSTAVANGWLQGPGGVRRLACRYASVVDWIYKSIHNSNTTAPMCATGNSAGAGAISYAVSEYGLASEFSLVEPTGGPVMTLLHQGCSPCSQFTASNFCTQTHQSMCYSVSSGGSSSTAEIIDNAYQAQGQTTPTVCTDGVNGNNKNFNRLLSDSIEDDPSITTPLPIVNPPTTTKVVLGTLDTTSAVLQGYAWWGAVGPPPQLKCIADAAHAIPAVQDGADQIVSDIETMCKVH